MTKGEKVERLLAAGMTAADAARKAGVSYSYAMTIQWCGSYSQYLSYRRTQERKYARKLGIPQDCSHGGVRQYDYTPEAVVSAINRGMSYGDVARAFGITRNVVAGCLYRHSQRVDA